MNATGLPIPNLPITTVQAGAPDPALGSVAGATPAPTDFMLALAQMLGATQPGPVIASEHPGPARRVEDSAQLDEQLQVALATVAVPLPLHLPVPSPSPAPVSVSASVSAPMSESAPPVSVPVPVMVSVTLPSPSLPTTETIVADANDADQMVLLGLDTRPDTAARDAAFLQALTERHATLDAGGASHEPQLQPSAIGAPAIDVSQDVRPSHGVEAASSRTLHSPLGTPAWREELGARLTLMAEKGSHTASLRLSPEHLGPLEVRIAIRDDQASVWFGAAHTDTRAAIEHALPRLREMFEAQGMSLADAGVSREAPRDPPTSEQRRADASEPEPAIELPRRAVRVGLVDAYA